MIVADVAVMRDIVVAPGESLRTTGGPAGPGGRGGGRQALNPAP